MIGAKLIAEFLIKPDCFGSTVYADILVTQFGDPLFRFFDHLRIVLVLDKLPDRFSKPGVIEF